MAKLQEILTRTEKDKPSSYDETKRTEWINEVNALIHSDVHHSTEEYSSLTHPTDSDTELLVKSPYDKVYDYYVFAMIDFLNNELAGYNNYTMMYNKVFSDYHASYLRKNMPVQTPLINIR